MIDRNYLPFKSAKEYIDRGMAKWMGFFLSEHTTALQKEGDSISIPKSSNIEDITMLLGHLYLNNIKIKIFVKDYSNYLSGVIKDINNSVIYISLSEKDKILNFKIQDIEKIELDEDLV